ncbi:hypothetical protein FJV46_03960 [Arthrobacter agilis]|uniref:hypothetical protein n=1 Tax=Arthrobacter agilis TaxID=37921 RepID=UPI00112C89E6|nr:hypothetical protein [Arthrobacter agilis]TPV26990.1 hypothetical protein FJV46_03960 [Arthrobacter agilis]
MVFSLDSSLVLVAIVGLWLVWVAPFLLRGTMPDFVGITRRPKRAGTRRSGGSMMTMTTQQDQAPTAGTTSGGAPAERPTPAAAERPSPASSGRTAPATDRSELPGRPSRVRSTRFSPRWGRIGVALVGALALIALPVTLVLAALGIVPFLVPAVSAVVAAACIAVLRALAIRSRRARVDRAFLEAMAPVQAATTPEPVAAQPVLPAAPRRPTALFDAEETPERPLTAMELRTAALAVANGASALDVRVPQAATVPGSGTAGWEPVEVPRPTYVDAAKAERQAPAPLDLPVAPRPVSKTPIKASEAAARAAVVPGDGSSLTGDALTGSAVSGGSTGDEASARAINLDDVLQRRRA